MNPNNQPLQKLIDQCLIDIVTNEITHNQQQQEKESNEEKHPRAWIINFRDPTYSAEEGGYHPVEIMMSQTGIIHYITDFSYVGQGPYAELVKELDFEMISGEATQMGMAFELQEETELFKLFQQNFCNYYQMGVYQVEVNPLG